MTKQIVRVSLLQSAKVMACLYLILSLPMVAMMAIPMSMQGTFSWVFVILMPVFYTLFGFLFTLLGAWIYNLVAARIGGFEFTTAEVAPVAP